MSRRVWRGTNLVGRWSASCVRIVNDAVGTEGKGKLTYRSTLRLREARAAS